jgi:hypothetical protein
MIFSGGNLMQFVNAGTVFTSDVVAGFVKSLRKIRIFVPPDREDMQSIVAAARPWLK